MSAKQAVIEILKTIFDEGTVNAMQVFKGFSVDTGETGWHYQKFGTSGHTFVGKSVEEVRDWSYEVIDAKAQEPYLYGNNNA